VGLITWEVPSHRTPIGKCRTPVQTGPLGKVPNLHGRARTPGTGLEPPCVGSRLLIARSRDSGTKNTQALIKVRRGSGADTCPDHTAYASAPRSGGDPMLPRGLLPVT
jgi:hypothetical protein